jgi:hypothetical protein
MSIKTGCKKSFRGPVEKIGEFVTSLVKNMLKIRFLDLFTAKESTSAI